MPIKECFDKIKPYLKDINNLQKSDTWEIQLTEAINLISSKDIDEESVMHQHGSHGLWYSRWSYQGTFSITSF